MNAILSLQARTIWKYIKHEAHAAILQTWNILFVITHLNYWYAILWSLLLMFSYPYSFKSTFKNSSWRSTRFSCPFCGQILSSESKLKRHTRRKYGGAEAEFHKCYRNIVFKILFLWMTKLSCCALVGKIIQSPEF